MRPLHVALDSVPPVNLHQQLNDGGLFIKLNKLISKFAHPTALTVLTMFDQTERDNLCDMFLAIGAGMFSAAFTELELHLNK